MRRVRAVTARNVRLAAPRFWCADEQRQKGKALRKRNALDHASALLQAQDRDRHAPLMPVRYGRASAVRARATRASWCGCQAFDFVVLAADAIEPSGTRPRCLALNGRRGKPS